MSPRGIAEVEEAIKIDPDNARSHMILGAMQISQQNIAEAEAAFKRAVEVDPKSLDAKQALASFYWATNRLPEAEEWLRQAVALDPTQPVDPARAGDVPDRAGPGGRGRGAAQGRRRVDQDDRRATRAGRLLPGPAALRQRPAAAR